MAPGLPASLRILGRALRALRRQWLVFGLIAAVYLLAYLIFIQGAKGLSTGSAAAGGSTLLGGLTGYALTVNNLTTVSPGQAISQLLLVFICSLATIWALRQVYAEKAVTMRQAFYGGMYPLVPALVVVAVMLLQLVPMLLGINLYELVAVSGVATNELQLLLFGCVAIGLSLVSLYMLAASVPAFYVATLPDMTPLAALRSAKQVVAGRRWSVLLRLLSLPLVLIIVSLVVTVPFVIISSAAAAVVLTVLSPLLLVVAQAYYYTMYRELIGE